MTTNIMEFRKRELFLKQNNYFAGSPEICTFAAGKSYTTSSC